MQFVDKLAAQAADNFKDTADELWAAIGKDASQSRTVRNAKFSAGKYATLATVAMMFNFPDNATIFRDSFNGTGNGPTGAAGFAQDKDVTANEIARTIANTADLSMNLALQAFEQYGSADIAATSTLTDVRNLIPLLTKKPEPKPKKKELRNDT